MTQYTLTFWSIQSAIDLTVGDSVAWSCVDNNGWNAYGASFIGLSRYDGVFNEICEAEPFLPPNRDFIRAYLASKTVR
jgi:hypothetical protein